MVRGFFAMTPYSKDYDDAEYSNMMIGHLAFNISHRLNVRPQGKDGAGKTRHTVANLQTNKPYSKC